MGNSNELVLEGKALNNWKASKIKFRSLRCHFHQRKDDFPELLKAKQQSRRHVSVAAKPSGSQSGVQGPLRFNKYNVNHMSVTLIACGYAQGAVVSKMSKQSATAATHTLTHRHMHIKTKRRHLKERNTLLLEPKLTYRMLHILSIYYITSPDQTRHSLRSSEHKKSLLFEMKN